MARIATLDDLVNKKKPVIEKVPVVLDAEVARRWNRAIDQLEAAQRTAERTPSEDNGRKLAEAQQAVEALREEYDEAIVEVHLRAIGGDAYDELKAQYPPTEEQEKEVKKENALARLAYNPEEFPNALLAASLVAPKMTKEQVDALFENPNYNAAQLTRLVQAAQTVNVTVEVAKEGKGFERTGS